MIYGYKYKKKGKDYITTKDVEEFIYFSDGTKLDNKKVKQLRKKL